MQSTGQGGFFIAPSSVQQTIVHNADKISGRMTCRWVFLKVKINDVYYLDDIYSFPTVLPDDKRDEMNAVFDTLFDADCAVDEYICYYRIIKILLSVGSEVECGMPSYIGRSVAFMKEHYTEKLTVQDIAGSVNLSASHFYSVFKKQMGISPIAFLNNYRLSLAAELLSETNVTVTEAAYSVGVNDVAYFNKMFKKFYQLPPTEYRKL